MAKDAIKVSATLPATPHDVYEAWLDSALHGRMTGGSATIDKHVGGRHRAWDGYIEGTNVELEPGRRIVQTWRTSDFPADAADSTIEIRLESEDGSTRITIEHVDIPEGQGRNYESGWRDHYFRPMHEYFTDLAADDAEPVTEAMPFTMAAAVYAASPPSDDVPTLKAPRVIAAAARKTLPSEKRKAAKKKAAKKKATPKKMVSRKATSKKATSKKATPKKAAKKTAVTKKPVKKPVAKKAKPKKAAKSNARSKKRARR